MIAVSLIGIFTSVFAYQTIQKEPKETEPLTAITNNNGILLNGATKRDEQGSNYWQTSNIREWLNSRGTVNYTSQPPTSEYLGLYAYDQEMGFLTAFTNEEYNNIAITQHYAQINNSDAAALGSSGNSAPPNENTSSYIGFAIPSFTNSWANTAKQIINDKVFLLNPNEVLQYFQYRGWSVEKKLTSEAQQKHNYSNSSLPWFVISARIETTDSEQMLRIRSDSNVIEQVAPNNNSGIVPALHLKPTAKITRIKRYETQNTKSFNWIDETSTLLASQLQIGDIIEFGTYLNAPIQWRVVNITPEGYPLIVTEYAIDLKAFDSPGDRSYAISNIQFETPDLIATNDYYTNIQKSEDRTLPLITITNVDEIYERKNGSYTLHFEVSDNSGISRIILPNGKELPNTSTFSYTVTENKFYDFKAIDQVGNVRTLVVPVGNINIDSQVILNPSTTNWTNQPVSVQIQASNDSNYYASNLTLNGRDLFSFNFPNYSSYADKRFRIKATINLISANRDVESYKATVGLFYYYTNYTNNEFQRKRTWISIDSVPLSQLKQGSYEVDTIFTVPSNYFGELKTWFQLNVNHGDNSFKVTFTDVSYELLDNDDFAIQSITLPNGTVQQTSTYTDTLSTEGIQNWTYKVLDNRGKTVTKTITTKIDYGIPVAKITELPGQDNRYELSATDSLSGISKLQYKLSSDPTNTWMTIEDSKKVITVDPTGQPTISLRAYDLAGNVSQVVTQVVSDYITPTLETSLHPETWTKENVIIRVLATDRESGIKTLTLPDQSTTSQSSLDYTVNQNGQYTFLATDKSGNQTSKTITVSNIDRTPPTIQVENLNPTWTNQKVVLELSATDTQSGVKHLYYQLTGATSQSWLEISNGSTLTFSTTGKTELSVKAVDQVGNETVETFAILIDQENPQIIRFQAIPKN